MFPRRGIDKLRLGSVQAAQPLVTQFVEKLLKLGLSREEIRRLLEAELIRKEDFVRRQK
ncbi:MAG TPA: hypothetical protein VK308_04445 [Pyrinomonadaceae bacterium]|nr:hypothetical protein [Pyrinomonadaceae bacterium]